MTAVDPPRPPIDTDLLDLVAEGHAALAQPAVARVSAVLTIAPLLVDALDRVCQYQVELRDTRRELTVAVRAFREAVWDAQKAHPEVTYRAAHVQTTLRRVSELLDRLDRLIHP